MKKNKRKIARVIQLWLLIAVTLTFIVTSVLTFCLQTKFAKESADATLQRSLQDVQDSIELTLNDYLRSMTEQIVSIDVGNLPCITGITKDNLTDYNKDGKIDDTDINKYLSVMVDDFYLQEINLIDKNGIIIYSNVSDYIGYDMKTENGDNTQSSDFYKNVTHSDGYYIQDSQANSFFDNDELQYVGTTLDKDCYLLNSGGIIQVGYNNDTIQAEVDYTVRYTASSRRVGESGTVMICEENSKKNGKYNVVGMTDAPVEENLNLKLEDLGINFDKDKYKEGVSFEGDLTEVPSYCMYQYYRGYYFISSIPESEAMETRNIFTVLMIIIEFFTFAVLFILIYIFINQFVVKKIQTVNDTLTQISDGNLDVTVDVRTSAEFNKLSDDINSTVDTLKNYIAEAAARIDKELEFAKAIQHSAMPSLQPLYSGRNEFEIYAQMDTAKEVGGDFYDFYFISDDKLAFLIADVSGKGIPAALFMMTAKTLIKSLAEAGLSVNDIFTVANQKLCENNDAGMFVTAWMGILDLKTGVVTFANAGHNPPLVCRSDGSFEYYKVRPGFVLAGMEGIKYRKNELQLAPGDVIYLYTDGVTEATDLNENLYGEEKLKNLLNSLPHSDTETICKAVKNDVDVFVGEAPQFDDITMLCLKYKAPMQSGEEENK
jgi:serine phosphatase RsbU (regulator of sigma subunit)